MFIDLPACIVASEIWDAFERGSCFSGGKGSVLGKGALFLLTFTNLRKTFGLDNWGEKKNLMLLLLFIPAPFCFPPPTTSQSTSAAVGQEGYSVESKSLL